MGGVPAPHGAGPPPPGSAAGRSSPWRPGPCGRASPPAPSPGRQLARATAGGAAPPPQPRRGPAPAAKLRDDGEERQRATRPGATRKRSAPDRPPALRTPGPPHTDSTAPHTYLRRSTSLEVGTFRPPPSPLAERGAWARPIGRRHVSQRGRGGAGGD